MPSNYDAPLHPGENELLEKLASRFRDTPEVEEAAVRFNHATDAYGVWVPFIGCAYPDLYSVRTKDGTEYPVCFPRFDSNGKVLRSFESFQINLETEEINQSATAINPADVAELALVAHDGPYAKLFSTDVATRRRKSMLHAQQLGIECPGEDYSLLHPEQCKVISIELSCVTVNNGKPETTALYPVIKCGGEAMTENADGSWSYVRECSFELDPKTARLPKPLRLLKQFGCHVVIVATTGFTVTDVENIATTAISDYRLEIINPGRATPERINKIFTTAGFGIVAKMRFKRVFKKED